MKKKILYLYSDTGGGHRASAQALMNAVEQLHKDEFQQEMLDVFAACSGFLNIFAKLYAPVIRYYPKLWGQLFYWLDDKKKLERLEQMSRPFILKELIKLIKKKKPDIIVSVHPMVNHLTASAIKESGIEIPFIVVITDPVTLHRAWITPKVDLTVVATPEAEKNALSYGMPAEKLKVIGMPIDPKFSLSAKKKASLRKKDNLEPKLFTILLMGGGEGAGKMHTIIKELDSQKISAQLIVIAGRNEKLVQKLNKEAEKIDLPLQVYGFTDKVNELMAESDMIITKAGPGTIAEALAMGLPIIITSWLPGQEEGNVEFVVRENVGRVSKDPKKVGQLVKELMEGSLFDELKANIARVSRPNAALEIADEILIYL